MNKKWIIILIPLIIFLAPAAATWIQNKLAKESTVTTPSAQELRNRAIKAGFKPNPKTKEELFTIYTDPPSKELIALGKALFFDPILSKDGTISCASCHILSRGGDDNRPTAVGYHGKKNPFHLNSPTVLNAAEQKFQFWDARAKTLQEQAAGPITAPFEMALTPKEAVEKIAQSPYKKRFEEIFKNGVTFQNITKAIAAYEKTLLTRSRFDLFLEGNLTALSKKEQQGLSLFMDIGCKACHFGRSIGGQIVQKFPIRAYNNFFYPHFEFRNGYYIFRKIVFQKPSSKPFPFDNRGGFLGKNMSKRFKVPVLRDIARTAPYFHNGSVQKLEDAIRIMAKHQRSAILTDTQTEELAAFLRSLSGELVDYGF